MIQNDKNKKVFVIPSKGARVLLNGNEILSKKEINYNDRSVCLNAFPFSIYSFTI